MQKIDKKLEAVKEGEGSSKLKMYQQLARTEDQKVK